MNPSAMLPALRRALDAEGLLLLGGFDLEPGEPGLADLRTRPAALLLVGNGGSAMWQAYQVARRRCEQGLDTWTEHTVGRIAAEFGLAALYPFLDDARSGDAWPFTRWAIRTGRLFASPLGLTVHPTYGLWHAFRAALLLPEPLNGAHDGALDPDGDSPCERCADRPCLDACPVAAFTGTGYDFEACLDHLAGPPNPCRAGGCLARCACPVGRAWRYEPDHAAFHMAALIEAHRVRRHESPVRRRSMRIACPIRPRRSVVSRATLAAEHARKGIKVFSGQEDVYEAAHQGADAGCERSGALSRLLSRRHGPADRRHHRPGARGRRSGLLPHERRSDPGALSNGFACQGRKGHGDGGEARRRVHRAHRQIEGRGRCGHEAGGAGGRGRHRSGARPLLGRIFRLFP